MLDLSAIPIVDQHAHNLVRPETLSELVYLGSFTEGYAEEIVSEHVRETLFYRRSLRDVAAFLRCAPELPAVLAARDKLGFEETAQRFFDAGNFQALMLDDGFVPDKILPTEWHARFAPVHRILRVEFLAENLICEAATWADFEEGFRSALRNLPEDVVSLKSIAAYRTGLAIAEPDAEEAETSFELLRDQMETGAATRLADKPLNDWVAWTALEAAAAQALPIQFHTGFGDPDLDLRYANPLHMRPLFENPAFADVRFVLLHASYPFTREAGYLAAVYPNVYVDLGLAIPFLSVAGMRFVVRAFLELTPISKILFSTDAHVIPELFYVGALWGRRVLAGVLEETVQAGDLTASEAESAADDILRGNANRLYRLPA
ncbi:MAG: hypothetical protein MAG451_00074 [Anaerolineales bacterium]|nr:hypothetical protein [Anaerolineales bacterium]